MDTPQLDLLQQPMAQTRQNQLLKVLKQIQLLILLPAQGVAVLMVRNGHIFYLYYISICKTIQEIIWNFALKLKKKAKEKPISGRVNIKL